ncbi:hypothetical protein SFRURICE_020010 [Spodoptera frugiperda]|nr:hypothetical protein SFRURICE_020010 [Spodoptera frugiperda]
MTPRPETTICGSQNEAPGQPCSRFSLAEMHITECNAAIRYTFHHLCYKSYVIESEPIAIYWVQFQKPCYY